jgi:metallo-beta-lactamase class B
MKRMRIQHTRKLIFFIIALLFSPSATTAKSPSQDFDWNQPFKPFRVIANIYYVGTNDLACYLITTPSGHILLDTALEQSHSIVSGNIEALGFKLKDIKIILSSHAHFDPVAGHADMKAATGAKVFASEKDADILESGGTKSFFPLTPYKPVKVDRRLKDGDIVKLGDVQMQLHLTPGHTEGNSAWTTVINEDGKKLDVVFAASMSINPGVHMVNFKPWPNIADVYARSFETLKKLHCDVFLGPHARFFNMAEKVQRMNTNSATNPFIDPDGYQNFLGNFERAYKEQIKHEQTESP